MLDLYKLQEDLESGLFFQKEVLEKYNISIKRLRTFVNKNLLKKEKWNLKKYKADENTKLKISEARKSWLANNPDKHPWKNKQKSIPCEKFKSFLLEKNIFFIEEALISKERFYSVDILIPDFNSIIEINGNQHYNSKGELKKYYEDRNLFIRELGWNVYEIHYSLVYDKKNCEYILERIKENKKNELDFYIKQKKNKKHKNREEYWKFRKENKKKNYEEKLEKLKRSNIKFDKFGWVNLASKILEDSPQCVGKLLINIDPEFYKNCYKRNIGRLP